MLEVVCHAGLDRRLGPERTLFNARAVIERYPTRQVTADGAVRGASHQTGWTGLVAMTIQLYGITRLGQMYLFS